MLFSETQKKALCDAAFFLLSSKPRHSLQPGYIVANMITTLMIFETEAGLDQSCGVVRAVAFHCVLAGETDLADRIESAFKADLDFQNHLRIEAEAKAKAAEAAKAKAADGDEEQVVKAA